jgi:lysophospholipase L1-like esterase
MGFILPIGDWWSRNEAIFKAILEDCRSSGVPVLLVRLPSRNWREFPNLQRLVVSDGADWLDLGSPGMRPSYGVHFLDDGHMNRAGHAFVAEKVSAWISERSPTSGSAHMFGEHR